MVDDRHMRRALELAQTQRTHPNPRVGVVLVDGAGSIIGEGAHAGPGREHAEVIALQGAGEAGGGSTLYVTLEPCVHRGRTPPCVDAIIAAGVARVVVGAGDPDPRVSGRGISRLRDAGIEVVAGVLESEARLTDPAYFQHRETGMPRVTLKYAMTIDGSVAAADGTSQWITSEEARGDAHLLRAEADAVVVGAGTVRTDDPTLTVRLPAYEGPQPEAVIIAGRGDLPAQSRIWAREPTVVTATERDIPSGRVVLVDGVDGLPDPEAACLALADLGYLDLLLEGGPSLAGAWWRAGVVSRGVAYLGAGVGGGRGMSPLGGVFSNIAEVSAVSVTGVRNLGGDLRIDFGVGSVHRNR